MTWCCSWSWEEMQETSRQAK